MTVEYTEWFIPEWAKRPCEAEIFNFYDRLQGTRVFRIQTALKSIAFTFMAMRGKINIEILECRQGATQGGYDE